MAINLGNFGNTAVQRPQMQPMVQQPSTGAAVVAIGQMLGNVHQAMEQEKAELNKARGGTFMADLQVATHALGADLNDRVSRGEVKPEEMVTTYQKEAAALKSRMLLDKDPSLVELVSGPADNYLKGSEIPVFDMSKVRIRDGYEAELVKTKDALGAAALSNPAGAVANMDQVLDSVGPKAGWDQAKIATAKAGVREDFWYNSKYNWASQEGSISALKKEEEKLKDESYLTELGGKRNTYRDQVQGRIREIRGEMDKAKTQYEITIGADVAAGVDLVGNGYKLSPDAEQQVRSLPGRAKGTKYEKQAKELVKAYDNMRSVITATPAQRKRMLQTAETDMLKGDMNEQLAAQKKYSQMTGALDNMYKDMRTGGLEAATKYFGIEFPALDFNQPLGPQMSQRIASVNKAEAQDGIPKPLLRADEVAGVKMIIDSGNSKAVSDYFASFRQAGGPERLTQTISTIYAKDPSVAGVAVPMMYGYTTTDGRKVGDLAMNGRKLVERGDVKLPSEQAVSNARVAFSDMTGLEGDSANLVWETTMAVYSQLAYEAGERVPAEKAALNDKLLKRAASMATGGYWEYQGKKMVAPKYGMTKDQFEDAIGNVGPQDIQGDSFDAGGRPLNKEQALFHIKNSPVAPVPGKNAVWVYAGNGFLTDANGKRIEVPMIPEKRKPTNPNYGKGFSYFD